MVSLSIVAAAMILIFRSLLNFSLRSSISLNIDLISSDSRTSFFTVSSKLVLVDLGMTDSSSSLDIDVVFMVHWLRLDMKSMVFFETNVCSSVGSDGSTISSCSFVAAKGLVGEGF